VRDPVSVAESLVVAARTGGRWDREDLAFAASVAFADVPPSGAARVLAGVLREVVTRMAADFRAGIDVIDPIRSLIAGMPAGVLAGVHRSESWHVLWVLLGDVARQRCSVSGTDPLIAAMVRCSAELSSHSSASAAVKPRIAIGPIPLMALAAKGTSPTGPRASARLRLRRKIEDFVK
jgi:hypothetical protein